MARSFSRGREGLEPVGDPIHADGQKIISICFATPENVLINDMLAGRSIRSYIEEVSDSKLYDHLINFLNDYKRKEERQLSYFTEKMLRLEETRKRREESNRRKEEIMKEIANLPKISESEIAKQDEFTKRYNEKMAEVTNLSTETAKMKGSISGMTRNLEGKKSAAKERAEILEEIAKEHPEIEKEIREEHRKHVGREQDLEDVRKRINYLDTQLKITSDALSKRKRLQMEEACPACGQSATLPHFLKRQDQLSSSLKEQGVREAEVRGRINTIEKQIDLLEAKKERLYRERDELKRINSEISGLERKIKSEQTKYKDAEDKLRKA